MHLLSLQVTRRDVAISIYNMTNRYVGIKLSLLVITAVFVLAAPFAHAALQCCAYEFKNPLTSGDLPSLLRSVRAQLFPFAVTIVTLIIMGYGFLYVYYSSTENQSGLKKLKENAIKLLIGVAIVAGSGAILAAVQTFVNGIK